MHRPSKVVTKLLLSTSCEDHLNNIWGKNQRSVIGIVIIILYTVFGATRWLAEKDLILKRPV
jgi:hypothetical protein